MWVVFGNLQVALSRLYIKRLKKHSDQGKKGKFEYNANAMWLLSNGREVNYSDIYKAFCIASSFCYDLFSRELDTLIDYSLLF